MPSHGRICRSDCSLTRVPSVLDCVRLGAMDSGDRDDHHFDLGSMGSLEYLGELD